MSGGLNRINRGEVMIQKGEGFEYHLLAIALALAVIINGAGAVSIDRAYTKTH